MIICYIYIVNKHLSAAGVSEDNAQGRKIVRRMNSWPRSEACGQLLNLTIILRGRAGYEMISNQQDA